MLTALSAKNLLSAYAGANLDFYTRLSLVLERLLKSNNGRGSKQLTSFTVYSDVNGNSVITLPRELNTVLAGVFVTNDASTRFCGRPLPIHNSWYQYMTGGPGLETSLRADSFLELPGRYTTFVDWTTALLLRFKFEQSETAGKIIVRGTLAGDRIYSTDGSNWIDGVAVSYTGNTTVTTTQLFDLPPTAIIKPTTKGRVSMYTVDSDGVETLVAVYDPTETLPAWRRYQVPACTTPTTVMLPSSSFYTKAEVQALFGDSSPIVVNTDVTEILGPTASFAEWTQPVTAQAGVAPYVAKFVLRPSYALKGASFTVVVDLAQSSHPKIQIYDGTSNTVIQEINGDSGQATSFFFEGEWNGSNWQKVSGYFMV